MDKIRIATPNEVNLLLGKDSRKAEEFLRNQGYDLGNLTIKDFLVHFYESSLMFGVGFRTSIRTDCGNIGGFTLIKESQKAREYLEEMTNTYMAHRGWKPPFWAFTSPEYLEDVLGAFRNNKGIRKEVVYFQKPSEVVSV